MTGNDIKFFDTFVPTLDELASVLEDGLKKYFADVSVSLVDTPDFSKRPFEIAVGGLHGKPTIADVGGVHNLTPHVNLDSKYNLEMVVKSIYESESDYPVSTFGPGGGAFNLLGYCCEFMGSATYSKEGNDVRLTGCACRYAYIDEKGDGQFRQQDNDCFGLMGNFYSSQNKQGKVLKIRVKKRISDENYTEAIRAVLLSKYGQGKPVSMGGVFLVNNGVAKLHIMPKHWPKEPSTDESINNEWLKYYEITEHPLVSLSVFHSYDPGYNLRMEHTHCFNLDTQGEAGHYHYDVTPETIEYEGYFNVAERVYRLDGPHKK